MEKHIPACGEKGLYNCLIAFRSELPVLIYEKKTKNEAFKEVATLGSTNG